MHCAKSEIFEPEFARVRIGVRVFVRRTRVRRFAALSSQAEKNQEKPLGLGYCFPGGY